CRDTDACRNEAGGYTLMREMNVHDFQCSTCKTTFSRSLATEGYKCIYEGNSMCTTGRENDRDVYCRKICAMSHCPKFSAGGDLEKCPALAAYRENGNIGDQDLMEKCAYCKLKDKCPERCRVGQFMEAVKPCVSCSERKRGARLSLCRPHVLAFDNQWEAPCPSCEANRVGGKIRPILARTFAAFIKGLWSYSNKKDDDNFCEILSCESAKVAEIQDILAMDRAGDEV
ncbi:MAG: hypothetical protein K2L72_01505, partial [Clostridia bacterium]|nr:hypothetical protein [Clostridia bacterium]